MRNTESSSDVTEVMGQLADMTPQERASWLQSFMHLAMQITAACPIELVDAVQQDARRWDTLGPILDPTTFLRVTGSKQERLGAKALAAFASFHREVMSLEQDLA